MFEGARITREDIEVDVLTLPKSIGVATGMVPPAGDPEYFLPAPTGAKYLYLKVDTGSWFVRPYDARVREFLAAGMSPGADTMTMSALFANTTSPLTTGSGPWRFGSLAPPAPLVLDTVDYWVRDVGAGADPGVVAFYTSRDDAMNDTGRVDFATTVAATFLVAGASTDQTSPDLVPNGYPFKIGPRLPDTEIRSTHQVVRLAAPQEGVTLVTSLSANILQYWWI
jgi:hypothetical protein